MASAVIASQNESSWAHMGKIPYSSRHLNANPNPNPNKKPKQFHNAPGNGVAGRYFNNGDSPAVTQTAPDDAYSFNQTSTSRSTVNYGRYLTFNLASYTKSELLDLRKRLSAELEQIHDLQNHIDSSQLYRPENPRSHAKFKEYSGSQRPIDSFRSIPDRACNGSIPGEACNGFYNGNLDAVSCEALLKECRQIVAKLLKHKYAFVFKAPVDAVALGLHDYHHIVKRPMDLGTVKANLAKNLYPTPAEFAADVRLTFNNALLYNPKHDRVNGMAEQLLSRFEELFQPIQAKIDNSTNQQREREFQVSHVNEHIQYHEMQGNSWSNHIQSRASPLREKRVKQKASPVQAPPVFTMVERILMPMQAHSSASTSSNPPPLAPNHQLKHGEVSSPAGAPIEPVIDHKPGRGGAKMKLPKPKAKDPNKREMSMDEKQKLGIGLQSLPQEKMPQLLQIIRKRNGHMAQDGDEIELDIEALDTETLWELDRFVTNWKKFLSKTKRQSQTTNNDSATGITTPATPIPEVDTGLLSDKNEGSAKQPKDNDDEDVDIDDDMPATSFPPVEIEKDERGGQDHDHDDGGNACSSSSSSSSDSSSSSGISSCASNFLLGNCYSEQDIYPYYYFEHPFAGSDSGSSSESASDADDAQS